METDHSEDNINMLYGLIKQYSRAAGELPSTIRCSPDMEEECKAELLNIPLDDRPQIVVDASLGSGVISTPLWKLKD